MEQISVEKAPETDNLNTEWLEHSQRPTTRSKSRKLNVSKSAKSQHNDNSLDHAAFSINDIDSMERSMEDADSYRLRKPEPVVSETVADPDESGGSSSETADPQDPTFPGPELSYKKGVKKFLCSLCGATFTTNSYLTIHKRSHSGEKPYRCQYPQCTAAFTAASSLRRHDNTHTKARSFVCPDCGDVFTQSSSLNTHRRKHTGYRPFHCDQCPRTFVSSSHLKKHQLVHRGQKPHVCGLCGAQFCNPHNLKRHLMIHSGERPFMCRECGDSFVTKDDLKRHSQTHALHKQFVCRYCPAQFSRSGRLRKHEERHERHVPMVTPAGGHASGAVGVEGGEGLCKGEITLQDRLERGSLKCERFPDLSEPCGSSETGGKEVMACTLQDSGITETVGNKEDSRDSGSENSADALPCHFESSLAADPKIEIPHESTRS